MKIKEFQEATAMEKVKCVFCNNKQDIEIIEYEYIQFGGVLNLIYHCPTCKIILLVKAY